MSLSGRGGDCDLLMAGILGELGEGLPFGSAARAFGATTGPASEVLPFYCMG